MHIDSVQSIPCKYKIAQCERNWADAFLCILKWNAYHLFVKSQGYVQ